MSDEAGPPDEPGSPDLVYPVSGRRMKDVPERLRPREVFERLGAENVGDDVLLALILRTGTPKQNAIELAAHILHTFGSLTELAQASVEDLTTVKGVGPVKAQILKASLELAQRLAEEATPEKKRITTPEDAAGVLREKARKLDTEHFWVLCLDSRNGLKRTEEVTAGLLDSSLVHPREVFAKAIQARSAAVVLVHNHPSGDPSPSREDIQITRQLVEAGQVIEIRVLDHVILGRNSTTRPTDYVSLRESGMVTFSE